jgi:hypothetical protein
LPKKSVIILFDEQLPSQQKLFSGLRQTCGKEWMYMSLNVVDISVT